MNQICKYRQPARWLIAHNGARPASGPTSKSSSSPRVRASASNGLINGLGSAINASHANPMAAARLGPTFGRVGGSPSIGLRSGDSATRQLLRSPPTRADARCSRTRRRCASDFRLRESSQRRSDSDNDNDNEVEMKTNQAEAICLPSFYYHQQFEFDAQIMIHDERWSRGRRATGNKRRSVGSRSWRVLGESGAVELD